MNEGGLVNKKASKTFAFNLTSGDCSSQRPWGLPTLTHLLKANHCWERFKWVEFRVQAIRCIFSLEVHLTRCYTMKMSWCRTLEQDLWISFFMLRFYKYTGACICGDWHWMCLKFQTPLTPLSTNKYQYPCPSQRPPSLCQPSWFAGSCYLNSDSCGLNTTAQDLGSFQQSVWERWLTVPVDHPRWRLHRGTDMPHLFTNPPTLGNAARSC